MTASSPPSAPYKSTRFSSAMIAIGRVGLASLFLLGGINKLATYGATLESMRAVGLEPATLLLPLVIALELGGGALVAFGGLTAWSRKIAPMAALALAVFTLATNLAFHDFWTMEGELMRLELSLFFKNVAIAGALIFFAGVQHHAAD